MNVFWKCLNTTIKYLNIALFRKIIPLWNANKILDSRFNYIMRRLLLLYFLLNILNLTFSFHRRFNRFVTSSMLELEGERNNFDITNNRNSFQRNNNGRRSRSSSFQRGLRRNITRKNGSSLFGKKQNQFLNLLNPSEFSDLNFTSLLSEGQSFTNMTNFWDFNNLLSFGNQSFDDSLKSDITLREILKGKMKTRQFLKTFNKILWANDEMASLKTLVSNVGQKANGQIENAKDFLGNKIFQGIVKRNQIRNVHNLWFLSEWPPEIVLEYIRILLKSIFDRRKLYLVQKKNGKKKVADNS